MTAGQARIKVVRWTPRRIMIRIAALILVLPIHLVRMVYHGRMRIIAHDRARRYTDGGQHRRAR